MPRMPKTGNILPFPPSGAARGIKHMPEPQYRAGPDASSPLLDAANAYADAHGGGEGFFPVGNESVHLIRSFHEVENHHVYRPSLCITLQGAKQFSVGDETLRYGPMQCLIVGLDMPACGKIVAASPTAPFVGISIEFDAIAMREVMEQLEVQPPSTPAGGRSMFVADVTGSIADCVLRMVRLAETPRAVPILQPAIMREFYYWLLSGPTGAELCRQALPDTHLHRISRAIQLLRKGFTGTLPVERLAQVANMSVSSFHQHFKALTSMSPLQFQKQLRLLEGRRLMMSEGVNVAEAAYQVGYESPSQFSREYSRAFGIAPKRDALSLRATGL